MKFQSTILSVPCLVALTLVGATAAQAESTRVTSSIWNAFTDSKNQPIEGLQGKYCYKVLFGSGETSEVCESGEISTDKNGQISVSGVAVSWRGKDRPKFYEATFEVAGVKYTGVVPMIPGDTLTHGDGTKITQPSTPAVWPANCHDSERGRAFDEHAGEWRSWFDTTCNQVVHFEFHLPVSKTCSTQIGSNGYATQVCALPR